jgi:hypothetical protein
MMNAKDKTAMLFNYQVKKARSMLDNLHELQQKECVIR